MGSGNHMVDAQDADNSELVVEVGDVFKDENGIYWEVTDVFGNKVEINPAEGLNEKQYISQDLVDEMEPQQ
jgi:hypothetical protein